jgi:hypothetical protein
VPSVGYNLSSVQSLCPETALEETLYRRAICREFLRARCEVSVVTRLSRCIGTFVRAFGKIRAQRRCLPEPINESSVARSDNRRSKLETIQTVRRRAPLVRMVMRKILLGSRVVARC